MKVNFEDSMCPTCYRPAILKVADAKNGNMAQPLLSPRVTLALFFCKCFGTCGGTGVGLKFSQMSHARLVRAQEKRVLMKQLGMYPSPMNLSIASRHMFDYI